MPRAQGLKGSKKYSRNYMLNVKDIAVDWVKVGTMLVVSNWLTGGSFMDRNWQMSSLFTLLGFTAYHLSTRNFMTPKEMDGAPRRIADDSIKFGTMFIVSRLLSKGSLTDASWIKASIATLIGFAVYNMVVYKYVQGKDLSVNPKLQMAIDDWAKVGTMLLVSRLISCESVLDQTWVMGSLATLVGFTSYDLVTSHAIDMVF